MFIWRYTLFNNTHHYFDAKFEKFADFGFISMTI